MDDEPFNLQAMKIALVRSAQQLELSFKLINEITDYVGSAEEALDLMTNNARTGDFYALVITDCQMPGIDAYEFSEKVREFYGDRN